MKSREIAALRLVRQHLAGPTPTTPYQDSAFATSHQDSAFTTSHQLVEWMGCIQAQDYAMAKWAIGCRLQHSTAATIEQDFNEGKFIRTHVLRPTWHFVCPTDIRWMLRLSAPRIRPFAKPYLQQLGIDAAVLRKSKKIITAALSRDKKLTRQQLTEILKKEKIDTSDSRVGHLLMDAELDALICSAGRIGKSFAYGLLDEQAPKSRDLNEDEAIAELARRYFLSRGPATVHDLAWWAGLTLTDARKGLDAHKNNLQSDTVNGREYWFSLTASPSSPSTSPSSSPTPSSSSPTPSSSSPTPSSSSPTPSSGTTTTPATFLLPAFDEFTVAYKYRDDVLDPKHASACFSGLRPVILHNGRIAGTWQRTEKKDGVHIDATPFPGISIPARPLATATKKYAAFIENTL